MPILYIDQLKTPQGNIDIGLIRDDANELALCRGPCPEFSPLGDNLDDTVAQACTATQAASSDTTPVESTQVVALPRAPLAQPLSQLWSRLLGSRN